MKATTKYLRLHTRELMAAVDRGEEIIITWRGKARARLTGLSDNADETDMTNPAFKMWQDRDGDVDAQVRELRQPRSM